MSSGWLFCGLLGAAVSLPVAVPAYPESGTAVHLVHPGQSIQAAVDAARPGDTVLVQAGHYHESVLLRTSGVTLRGAGPLTVLSPPDGAATGACAAAGDGICVFGTADHPVTDARIESLTVSGFRIDGISASGTDGLTVRSVEARDNGQQGISEEKSVRSRVAGNTAHGNGQAGVFLANIADGKGVGVDTDGTRVSGNRLYGNRFGVVVRRLRNLVVAQNTVTGNCGGVFIVGDDTRPRAGDLTVRGNLVNDNNSYCPATDRLPYIQGSGIVLTGVEQTLVTDNEVDGNVGASPLSGGIVLFRSYVGGQSTDNTVRDNLVVDNRSADLADRDGGARNVFVANVCRVSEPAGRC
ncbi:right-handed parallel beta-helix repeat-containing protein [Streptacidiphilus melanogenes]|uniref:right-handed parallel beta-helix repeat-containing protein n=1 Tax=Streptacidiphilus melanogenes TaxID=411235 RepID=UPI0005A7B329|nr:right-handed parallel beta-helix repeat-containing protein [Streptacidiphilus melanogenes]